MSTALRERPSAPAPSSGPRNGGMPARRAVTRWAWRLFRREWRQQLLVLALITVAVAATIIGAAAATNNPPPKNAGFGTAGEMATFQAPDPHLASQIAALQQRFHPVDVIENQTIAVPGSINTYQLRAQNPHGPYGQPMLSLVSGHFPTGAGQVAVTSGVASDFGLRIGSVWHQGGTARRVAGIVQNPQSLLDEFALVMPGQVHNPTQVTVLFDGRGAAPAGLARYITGAGTHTQANVVNPESISVAGLVVGMLLIALVAVGGFTVLAQRRLRSLGMLASTGATDRHVRLVVLANGAVVGVAGAVLGLIAGVAGWLAYRPELEQSAHHLIGMFALPWGVIGLALLLAVVAAVFAAWLPARAITRVPIVTALSGRPAPPKQVRRSAIPGLILLVIAFILFGWSGASANGSNSGLPKLALGLVVLIVAVILLAPFCLAVLARLGKRTPISVRLALRDLSRYRARSGSALAAISIGILIAVIISVASAARFANALDYAGPNLAPNQLIVYTFSGQGSGGPGGPGPSTAPASMRSLSAKAHAIATALGTRDVVALETTDANLNHNGTGRQWSGPLYVATPQLLHAFGITSSDYSPTADILSMRPGLSGVSGMQLNYGNAKGPGPSSPGPGQNPTSFPCPRGSCVSNPSIQEVSALPSGTSAPNTVITEHAVRTLHLLTGPGSVAGWLIQTPNPLTSAQKHNAQVAAGAANMSVETRNSIPTSATIVNWATVFGIVLALAILAMSIGLIRSEAASDLRTLAATGASGRTRRNITAATAGALGFTGAVLGTVGGYVATAGWFRTSSLNGGVGAIFTTVPVTNLLIILIGMPLVAAIGGWIFAGRQPRDLGHQPLE
jgi:putative ABC transport system permease protein